MSVLILSNTDNVDSMIRDIEAVVTFKLCFIIAPLLMKNRSIHFVQKGSIPGANSTNTSKKKQKNPNTNMPVPKHRKPLIPPFYARYFKPSFDKVCRRE